jgi:hypothetical protein
MKAALAIAFALAGRAAGASPVAPPCAACIRWELTSAQAARLLEGRADLAGLQLALPAAQAEAAGALHARGAVVAVVFDAGYGTGPERAFRFKTEATRLRALHAGLRLGVDARGDLAAELAAYVDFVVTSDGRDGGSAERWRRAGASEALAATTATPGPVVAPWPGAGDPDDAPFAIARLAAVLGTALAPLSGVEAHCEPAATGSSGACDASAFLAPAGQVVVVGGGGGSGAASERP